MSNDLGTIANTPTVLKHKELDANCVGYHESLLRSYHIVAKLRWLIEKRVDHEVMLELLNLMQSDAFQPYAYFEQRYKEQYDPVQRERVEADAALAGEREPERQK